MAKVPTLFLHVRASIDGASIDDVAELRADLRELAAKYGDTWGVRIKRRIVTKTKADALYRDYAKRAAATARHPR